MKHFLLFLAIFIGVYGDTHTNLDSIPLLELVKGFLEKTLKTMGSIPVLKGMALANYSRNVKESLGSYFNCPGVQTLKHNLESVSNNSVWYDYVLECSATLMRSTSMIDNTYNKDVLDQIDDLFGKIDNITNSYKPKIDKIKNVLPKYVVKESCSIEELKDETCGALLDFEKVLQLYRVKIHEYTVELTLAASFVGKFSDNAWATVEQQLKEKVIDPVNDCIEQHDLDEHFSKDSH